jgi:putative colanic acid biosynthesis acetyltransferase WcaF
MGKVDLSTFNNIHFDHGAAKWKILLWYLINPILFRNPLVLSSGFKGSLLRMFGAKIGKGVVLKPGILIKYPWKLQIDDHAWIGENVWIDNLDITHISSHCCISQGAMLLTGSHNYRSASFDLITGPILLEEGVWIGAKAVVCPGVQCGKYSVLTVGSIATENLLENQIYQGNPAVIKRSRF